MIRVHEPWLGSRASSTVHQGIQDGGAHQHDVELRRDRLYGVVVTRSKLTLIVVEPHEMRHGRPLGNDRLLDPSLVVNDREVGNEPDLKKIEKCYHILEIIIR